MPGVEPLVAYRSLSEAPAFAEEGALTSLGRGPALR